MPHIAPLLNGHVCDAGRYTAVLRDAAASPAKNASGFMSGPKQVGLARFASYYGSAKIITAEVPLPPKNPEMTPDVVAAYCLPLSS
jgi:hypothetical protein